MSLLIDLVSRETQRFGIELDKTAYERLNIYADMLVERSKVMNLTAITDERGIALKHFADSLSLFYALDIPHGASLIDIGTGAGFPGVVVLIARPDIKLTLLDSTAKKLGFITDVLSACELKAEIIHARAEEAGKDPAYREKFDFATARAVANLRELSEYCLPFVKKGGCFISMKGAKASAEADDAAYALNQLGGYIEKNISFEIDECGERNIILIKKVSQTPPKYPRPGTQIAKHPLIG
ncbi:MAG: 16S rRNA (guanine(527)-N(7))-methyltransferase RsmG [Clostridia bacterium]|nr:16S rRNA (guanine(527)-N(7))-methyltransferase RsmG [Clostridia bacterium]